MTSHRIGRVECELVVGEVDLAAAITERTSRLLGRGLSATIERVCDEVSGPERLDRIDTLTLDLCSVRLAHFERDLLAALEVALRRALSGALSADGEAPLGRVEASIELLEVFALTGNSPWWAATQSAADDPLREAARVVAEAAPKALWRLLAEFADDRRGLARLADLFDIDDLAALIERRWSPHGAARAADLRRLAAAVDAHPDAGTRRGAYLRQAILAALGVPSLRLPSLLPSIVRAADERGLALPELARLELPPPLREAAQAIASSPSPARGGAPRQETRSTPRAEPAPPRASANDRERPFSTDAGEPASRGRVPSAARKLAAGCHDAASDSEAKAAAQPPPQPDDASSLAAPRRRAERVDAHDHAHHAHDQTPPPPAKPAMATSADIPDARAESSNSSARGASARVASARERRAAPPPCAHAERDPDPLRAHREARRRDAWTRLDELYVDDAGLVILWPFLGRLFARTALLDDEQRFRDERARAQGLALLSVLARRDPEPPEPLLALAKLLCGASPQAHVELERPLTDDQQIECERLLLAVLDYVPALGDLTVDDLRATFLRRPAALAVRNGVWTLAVERRPQDLVLERFPWSWRWLKLPWMPEPLRVEW